jgi:hypothetical protein
MSEITVRTQSELDTALTKHGDDEDARIIIDSPKGARIEVRRETECEVWADGSSTVWAYGSSTVWADGSSTVRAYGSSTVRADGSSTVRAYGSSTVRASKRVAIHHHNKNATIEGGVVIDCTQPITTIPATLDEWNITPTDGDVVLYKAVRDNYHSSHGTEYTPGTVVTADDWNDRPECGGGLHLSQTPLHAFLYDYSATRFLECRVAVADLAVCSLHDALPDKVKARTLRVVREVDEFGRAVESA